MSAVKKPTHDATVIETPRKSKPPCECDLIPVDGATAELLHLLGMPLECSVHPGKSVESDGRFKAIDGSWEAWLCRECLRRRSNYVRVS